jgi:hypothetical protein
LEDDVVKRLATYTFDASAGTVTFTESPAVVLAGIMGIINVHGAVNVVIYDPIDPLKGGSVLTNVLTLVYDTTTMNDTDELIVKYDDAITAVTLGVATDMEGGGKVSVGTTAVEMTFTGATRIIIIQADSANSGTIYVGKSNVTSAGAYAVAVLAPGDSIALNYSDASNAVYAVATVASQNVWKGSLLA